MARVKASATCCVAAAIPSGPRPHRRPPRGTRSPGPGRRTRSVIGTSAAPVSRASSAGPGRHPGRGAAELHVDGAPGEVAVGQQADEAALAQVLRQPGQRGARAAEREDPHAEPAAEGDELVEQPLRAAAARRRSSAASRSRRPRRRPSPSCPGAAARRPPRALRRTACRSRSSWTVRVRLTRSSSGQAGSRNDSHQ